MSQSDPHPRCTFGCIAPVPAELVSECLCVAHFTLRLERVCAEVRREIAGGAARPERQAEIVNFLGESAMTMARVAIGSSQLSDEMKKRILTTFLTLMNLRENLDHAANRQTRELRVAG